MDIVKKIETLDRETNIDKFISDYLSEVDRKIINNPQFKSMLSLAIHDLTETNSLSPYVPGFTLIIANGGWKFNLITGIRKSPLCSNSSLFDNKFYSECEFSLDVLNNMEFLTSSGVFYRAKDYLKNNENNKDKGDFSRIDAEVTPTILDVDHKHRRFLPTGIEIEQSTFSDVYPLNVNYALSDTELRIQTMKHHAPELWRIDSLANPPKCEFNPHYTNLFRDPNDLAIVFFQKKDGRNGELSIQEYAVQTEYPDMLIRSDTPFATRDYNQEIITDKYKTDYPNATIGQIKNMITRDFYLGILNSRTKDINPQVTEYLKESVRRCLINKYAIEPEQIERGITRG